MTDEPDKPDSPPEATEAPKPAAPQAPVVRSAEEIRRDPLVARTLERLNGAVLDAREFAGEVTLIIDAQRIREVCEAFKSDGFRYLVDLAGVDYSEYPGHAGDRFAVAYHLYSHEKNQRLRLKVFVAEDVAVPSVTSVWKTANWHERETWDMYGIVFDGHPNLERILMWDEFNGHPLRKDFPLRGIDTGARIYPEVFAEGAGPQPGSTGKDYADVNRYQGEWPRIGTWPAARTPQDEQMPPAPELAAAVADTAVPTEDAPFHDPDMPLGDRMELAKTGDLKTKLFAAMAQTDCTACGWDCEGYAEAIATGETSDLTLCVPGEEETESMLKKLMAAS